MKLQLNKKAHRNYLVDITALLPFVLLLLTGVIMLIYHSGTPEEERTLFLNGHQWLRVHKVLTVVALPLVSLHMIFHWAQILRLFRPGKLSKHKPLNLLLFCLLILTAATSLLSWSVFGESETGEFLLDVHNKFGMALIVFFSTHLALYINWLMKMTRRVIDKGMD